MIDKHKSQYADFEGENKNSKLRKKLILKGYNECEQIIEQAPTADVAEVKHGFWKKSQFSGRSGFYSVRDVICSECGIYSTFLQHEIRPDYYCPNCGAKMDGGKEE